jgi:hypothetical protein
VPGDRNFGAEPLLDRGQGSGKRRRWKAFWPWPAVLAVSIALTACGSNSASNTSVARSSSASSEIVTPVTTPQSVPVGTRTKHQSPPSRRVLAQINVVCDAVLHGWPRPLTRPYTVAKLSRYAAAAVVATRRVVVSLERLEQLGDASTLASLTAAWRQLQALYGSGEVVAHYRTEAASLGQQIVMHQQAVTALADADRFPACRVSLGR